eukprot:CAMPEP_0205885440 /NCGR_PEP_ID=MMETSP1083-20121108/18674_1 /ASSEMBLY_ACC=CAM_ASM_000430 /TAXON_ID=97485 /ORGANISM="Prymnesium parvum, Strain Texoma1" /LENGTH=63 /DNA_ID=CAMNT_0053248951 /DNA_START=416 /DNA_END=607 /DNA_ORIENTATION=-
MAPPGVQGEVIVVEIGWGTELDDARVRRQVVSRNVNAALCVPTSTSVAVATAICAAMGSSAMS